jgi:hypothetical protein
MPAQTEQITWGTSLSEARKRAAQEGKAILLDFSAAPE